MKKFFLFLFAAVLSIGTAMAEVVTITGDDCALEYTVEDGHALIITGTYLEQHSFELTLISDEEIDLTAESFDCDMQMMKIGEFGSVAWADEGTATVTIYPAAIEITATGLFDSAGDDQNTYNLEGVLAFPKSSAGGDDIVVDNEYFVDMPNLVATMDPALTFTASGAETSMGLGTVETYLECDWSGEVIPGNSTLNIPGMGLYGEVLAGTVAPVMDAGETTIVSATATVYVAFEGMSTFKFTLNMTAGGSGEQEEPTTVSVQAWNATLSQEYGTLYLDGSMNGLAVHAEVPGFEFVPDSYDWVDYSDVMVEVGTYGESDYVGFVTGDATVELDQYTITVQGEMTKQDGTTFVVYIQGSLQPANPMTSTALTLDGMTKTEVNRGMGRGFTQLEDDNSNSIEIYNLQGDGTFAYGEYLKVTASIDDVSLEGYGSWNEVDGVETLVATLYDDYYTEVYNVTATVSAQQMFTINSFDATYVVDAEYGDVTFRGVAEEGGEFEIVVGETMEGLYAAGYWGETEIVATEITDFELDFFDDTYYLGGTFQDAESNTYDVWVVAAPLPVYTRSVASGNFGTICLEFGSTEFTGAEFYELAGKEDGKVWLASVETLEAGVPYIFQATANELVVYSDGTTAATPGNVNGLHGTFTDDTEVATGNYILYNNAFCQAAATCYVDANRAYLVMSEVSEDAPQQLPGRRYIGMSTKGENEATGVDNITTSENAVKTIVNGQLVITIDGVQYNAMGVKL